MTTWLRFILTTPILPLLLLAAVPDPARAELSPEWKAALTDDHSSMDETCQLLLETDYSAEDAVEAHAWIRDYSPAKRKPWYIRSLAQGIYKNFDESAELRDFVASMPDSSRPFSSRLLAGYFISKKLEPSDLEFQECESKLIDDIVLFFRDDPEVSDEYFMLVNTYDYFTNSYIWRHHQPADPNRSFSLLYDLFCRTRSGVLATDFASSIRTLKNPEAPALLAKEICGEGCRDSLINTTRRTIVDVLVRTPGGREVAAEILPKITDDDTYTMLLQSCQSFFGDDPDFILAVLHSYEFRYGIDDVRRALNTPALEPDKSGIASNSPKGSTGGFLRKAWPTVKQMILEKPEQMAPYSDLIAYGSPKDSLLQFAAEQRRNLSEPNLSSFTLFFANFSWNSSHPEDVETWLSCVGEDRLPEEVRKYAVSKTTRGRIRMRPAVERKKTRIDRRRR